MVYCYGQEIDWQGPLLAPASRALHFQSGTALLHYHRPCPEQINGPAGGMYADVLSEVRLLQIGSYRSFQTIAQIMLVTPHSKTISPRLLISSLIGQGLK